MAIVGSLVAYAVYRLVAGRTPIESPRRVMAAAVAGYVAINVSALLAAIEFGIQPMFFHDATGAPLYAPYPLHIAIPAMMIGHLTIAGLAELVVSAGVVAYLQRAEPSLLKSTAPGAVAGSGDAREASSGWRSTKPLWVALAMLMVLTPLGILAAGSAWGEWAPEDFANQAARQQMAASSGGQAAPALAPAGLQKLAAFWTAPMPRYAPPFLKSPTFGYMLSAVSGTGLILLVFLFAGWFAGRRTE
jgi:cobalt/nickel transport system permease protein